VDIVFEVWLLTIDKVTLIYLGDEANSKATAKADHRDNHISGADKNLL
jgi:hypothetical protein